MAHVSHRLKGAVEGALAGGGDPATSPLYVFGPFLRLVVASGASAGGLGRWPRVVLAVGLTFVVGVVVNRGPRLAARVFGPDLPDTGVKVSPASP